MASPSLNTSASMPLMKAHGSRVPLSYRGNTLVSPQARQMGADAIYATNENRRYCLASGETTCFVPKGKTRQGGRTESPDAYRAGAGTGDKTGLASGETVQRNSTIYSIKSKPPHSPPK